jgi:hypothetical protein
MLLLISLIKYCINNILLDSSNFLFLPADIYCSIQKTKMYSLLSQLTYLADNHIINKINKFGGSL